MLSQSSKKVVLSAPSQELTCFSYPQMLKSRSLSAPSQVYSEAFMPRKNLEYSPAPLLKAELQRSRPTFQWRERHCARVPRLMLPTSPLSNLKCWSTHTAVLDLVEQPDLSLLWLVTNTCIHQETSANHPHQDGSESWMWEFLLTVTFLWNSLLLELYLTFSSKNVSG